MGKVTVPLGDEHLKAIGQITANFAMLEFMISACIWSRISQDQKLGQIITAELSFRSLLALLSCLYRYRESSPKAVEELDGLLKEAAKAGDKRNTVTHSFWGASADTIARIKMTARKSQGVKYQLEEMSAQDIAEIADYIAGVAHKFMTSVYRNPAADMPSPGSTTSAS